MGKLNVVADELVLQEKNEKNEKELSNSNNNNNELKQFINNVLNSMGRYQWAIFLAISFNGIIFGINHTLTAFHIYTPTFYCKDNIIDTPNSCTNHLNKTCLTGYRFEDDDHTIVTEWSLICERRLLAPMVSTLYFVGVTCGSFICGILSDKYGRKKMFLICLFSQGALGFLLRYTEYFELFTVMRTLQGFFVQGLQVACLALLIEYSPPKLRVPSMISWALTYAIGLMLLGLMSYWFPNWRVLQAVISIPSVISILYAWLIPESISWLYATNRTEEALVLCAKTARLNGDKSLAADINDSLIKQINNKMESNGSSLKPKMLDAGTPKTASLLDVWKTPCLRKHLLINSFLNFVISGSYYGSVYFLNNVSGNRHLNFVIGAAIESVGQGLLYVLMTYIGRRFSIIFYQFTTAALCATICLIITLSAEDNQASAIAVTVISLLAKGTASSAFTVVITYTTELFPTICRGTATGTCGLWARIGSITAPFVMILAEYTSPIVPMGLFFLSLLIGGCLSFTLPETVNKILPNTLAEADEMWRVKK